MFKTDDRVRIKECGELTGKTGTILGLGSTYSGNINFYIVLFDERLETARAALVISSCLERISK